MEHLIVQSSSVIRKSVTCDIALFNKLRNDNREMLKQISDFLCDK
jgi:hypothetical protein